MEILSFLRQNEICGEIIHGDSDTIVPHHNSYDLYMAYQDKIQYELFPGADHGVSYMTDEPRYKKVVSDFLNN